MTIIERNKIQKMIMQRICSEETYKLRARTENERTYFEGKIMALYDMLCSIRRFYVDQNEKTEA